MKNKYYSIPKSYKEEMAELPRFYSCICRDLENHECEGHVQWHHPFGRKNCVEIFVPICEKAHRGLTSVISNYCRYKAITWYGILKLEECIPKRDWEMEFNLLQIRFTNF